MLKRRGFLMFCIVFGSSTFGMALSTFLDNFFKQDWLLTVLYAIVVVVMAAVVLVAGYKLEKFFVKEDGQCRSDSNG